MKKQSFLKFLIILTIIGIMGFQFYWLKQSYGREQKTLEVKAQMAFRSSILKLQAEKLHLDKFTATGDSGKLRVVVSDQMSDPEMSIRQSKEDILTSVNVIREKLTDTLKKKGTQREMIMVMNGSNVHFKSDSAPQELHGPFPLPHEPGMMRGPGAQIINLLYGVDSLQDSISISEVRERFEKELNKEKIQVPFTVNRSDSAGKTGVTMKFNPKPDHRPSGSELNEVSVGFAHPVKYQFSLGNTMPYLLKRISLPIIFSVILLGISILSFSLLYRNMQRQRRLAELKNEFISNITHELKTPIATVGVAIEALKNFNALQDPARTREYLDISSNELQRLGLLVDKVLKLSMFEKKEIELRYETVDLHALVSEVLTSMRLQLEKQHAEVNLTHTGDTTLKGDRLHLLSVIYNLVDNALKYSNGKPFIQIELNGTEQDVQLSVKDNGIGIAAEYQPKLFEKFFRVPTGDTHNAKGYGLGLSYAAHVVKQHGGIISVDSQPGLGTRFTVIIPRQSI